MTINRTLLAACRAVHIYLTMLGLLVMLLFGLTGFTINHESAFGAISPRVSEASGSLPSELRATRNDLQLVEHLRQTYRIRGAMTDFSAMPEEFAISFKDPGQIWEVSIDRVTGQLTVRNEQYNFVALLNNLHRGRYTGSAWGWVIDISAGLIVLACLTGFVLWLALPRRRQLGIAFLVLGTAATMAMVYFFVPGPDISTAERPPASRRN